MINKALGLIETYGYTSAVEASDACLKTANVEMIGLEVVGGGLITIKICGDVSSVKASIDAGAAAAKELGTLVSVNVIARTGIGLEKIIYPKEKQDRKNKSSLKEANKKGLKEIVAKRTINYNGKTISVENAEILEEIKVIELRKIARQLDEFTMDKNKIKYAKKTQLKDAISSYLKSKEE